MATSSDNTLDIALPKGWEALDDRQLLFVFGLLAGDFTADEIKIHCLTRWGGIRLLYKLDTKTGAGVYQCRKDKRLFVISAEELAEVVAALDWLDEMPSVPVCISQLHGHSAIAKDFTGTTFEKFLVCDNLYQGYLATGKDDLLDELTRELYEAQKMRPVATERVASFYWFTSVKAHFARLYPHFFQPVAEETNNNLLGTPRGTQTEAVNSMIRALTKGDITKEREILAFDTHRALTELDAQAREYQEFNKKYPSK